MSSQAMVKKRLAHPNDPEWRRGSIQLSYGALEHATDADKRVVARLIRARLGDAASEVLNALELT